jgi:hypothetical protein
MDTNRHELDSASLYTLVPRPDGPGLTIQSALLQQIIRTWALRESAFPSSPELCLEPDGDTKDVHLRRP